jgi:hypothetical protein
MKTWKKQTLVTLALAPINVIALATFFLLANWCKILPMARSHTHHNKSLNLKLTTYAPT